jgi:SnoaL-like polyketide cyclase
VGKFAEAVTTGNFDLFREAVAPECVDHDPAPGQGPGPEGYRTFFSAIRKAFPDMAVGLETMVERRGSSDQLGMLQQLGVTQLPKG